MMTSDHEPGAVSSPAEVVFYHLERQPLEAVLPTLLERTLERGWRAVVQFGSEDRLELMDDLLWTFRPESFLPHGRARDGRMDQQPIFLTSTADCPNGAKVRFFVDGAEPSTFSDYTRIVILFDGTDIDAVGKARKQWVAAKTAGAVATYWQQNAAGRWEKKG